MNRPQVVHAQPVRKQTEFTVQVTSRCVVLQGMKTRATYEIDHQLFAVLTGHRVRLGDEYRVEIQGLVHKDESGGA